jgi:hypothetical protein
MACYRISVLGMLFDYYFITCGDITKKEMKKWFRDNYTSWRIMTVKEVDVLDVDLLWAFHLQKENGEIKCI